MRLIPKSVTVRGSIKAYGYRDGISAGTEYSVDCEVPPDLSFKDLRDEMMKIRYSLDTAMLRIEAAKGTLPIEIASDMLQRFKSLLSED